MNQSARQSNLVFSRNAIRELDRAAIEEYGIPGMVLMENAACGLAGHALEMLESDAGSAQRIGIICGSGNNGGDGFALARHLHNRGLDVILAAVGSPRDGGDAYTNARICERMKLQRIEVQVRDDLQPIRDTTLLVDAIFGTGLDREVEDPQRSVIEWINESGKPVLAVDCPSGLDCERGVELGVAVRATRTATFVGSKNGFHTPEAAALLGEVHVVDIGAPRELAERLAQPQP